jgi:lariat debranching enzyme
MSGLTKSKLKIAINGCCHGQLNSIYKQLGVYEKENGAKIDVLLVCGDFQVRNVLLLTTLKSKLIDFG